MKTDPNESAFPEVQAQPQFNRHSYGLTKLEYMSALILANTPTPNSWSENDFKRGDHTRLFELQADLAVHKARLLIKRLNY